VFRKVVRPLPNNPGTALARFSCLGFVAYLTLICVWTHAFGALRCSSRPRRFSSWVKQTTQRRSGAALQQANAAGQRRTFPPSALAPLPLCRSAAMFRPRLNRAALWPSRPSQQPRSAPQRQCTSRQARRGSERDNGSGSVRRRRRSWRWIFGTRRVASHGRHQPGTVFFPTF